MLHTKTNKLQVTVTPMGNANEWFKLIVNDEDNELMLHRTDPKLKKILDFFNVKFDLRSLSEIMNESHKN